MFRNATVWLLVFFVQTGFAGIDCTRALNYVFTGGSIGATYVRDGVRKPFFRFIEDNASFADPALWAEKGRASNIANEIALREQASSLLRRRQNIERDEQEIFRLTQEYARREAEGAPAAELTTLANQIKAKQEAFSRNYSDYEQNQRELGELRFYQWFAQNLDQGKIEVRGQGNITGTAVNKMFQQINMGDPFDPHSPAAQIVVKEDLALPRGYGGQARELGAWLFAFREDYIRQTVAMQVHATGTTAGSVNTYEMWVRVVIPKGSVLLVGPIGPMPEGSYRITRGAGGVLQFWLGRWNPDARRMEIPVFENGEFKCEWVAQPGAPAFPLRRVAGMMTNQWELAHPLLDFQSRIRRELFDGRRRNPNIHRLVHDPERPFDPSQRNQYLYDPRIHEAETPAAWDRQKLDFSHWRDGADFADYSRIHQGIVADLANLRRDLLSRTPEALRQQVTNDLNNLQAELDVLRPRE